MNNYENEVFVSYAWGGESEHVVDDVQKVLAKRGINIVRDKIVLDYKDSIEQFEQRIGRGQCVVVIISDKYLRSEHCMYELVEVSKNSKFRDRVFPLILEDAHIYKSSDRLVYIKYWDEQINILNRGLKEIDHLTNLGSILDDLNKFKEIRDNFDSLTESLKDMNVQTTGWHKEKEYSALVDKIEHVRTGGEPLLETTPASLENLENSNSLNPTVKVLLSFSEENEDHQKWVKEFAERLKADGVETALDIRDGIPAGQLAEVFDHGVKDHDFILCICTPQYQNLSSYLDQDHSYDEYLTTDEIFVNWNRCKFIPVLRMGEWKDAAPAWLFGRHYIDLRDGNNSVENYRDLVIALRSVNKSARFLADHGTDEDDFEFVNRVVELAKFNLAYLKDRHCWQYSLMSSPSGYGKSRLLKRLIRQIENDPEESLNWNCCYIDFGDCDHPDHIISHIVSRITGEVGVSLANPEQVRQDLCTFVLRRMSVSTEDRPRRNILLVFDTIDKLTSLSIKWFYKFIHDVIVGSYISYEDNEAPFAVRIILSGIAVESFKDNYIAWEREAKVERHLKPPETISLPALGDAAVQDLVSRRSEKRSKTPVTLSVISSILDELLYLSGGHPGVIIRILDELIKEDFLDVRGYLRDNHERLIRNHQSSVVEKTLQYYPLPLAKWDVNSICVFRLITLDILEYLRTKNLISGQVDNPYLLSSLVNNQILYYDTSMEIYRSDIIGRIIYLDFSVGDDAQRERIQEAHRCAKDFYRGLIDKHYKPLNVYMGEWLFHALQVLDYSNAQIVEEWRSVVSTSYSTPVLQNDLKKSLRGMLQKDAAIKYLFRKRFNSDDVSSLVNA